jgi:hypothetical protein
MTTPIQNKTDVNIFHEITGESSKNDFGAEEDTTILYPELAARSRDNLSFRNYEQLFTHIIEAASTVEPASPLSISIFYISWRYACVESAES